MIPKWSSKFELKPGKWVFVPTPETIDCGRKIKTEIAKIWKPPHYYYHLREGGHVAALKIHLEHTIFLRVDIQDFFGSISKTRVTRCLRSRVGYKTAREWAQASTEIHPDHKKSIIPFGFVQSQIIAALCLSESALGKYLEKISNAKGVAVSVYVDDIVVSCSDAAKCNLIRHDLEIASSRAKFVLNAEKKEGPATAIKAFNIEVSKDLMRIENSRLEKFADALMVATTDFQREGILSYVASVNRAQADGLVV